MPGTGSPKAIIETAAPSAANWRVRARPNDTSARWPQTGTATVNPAADAAATMPTAAGSRPRWLSITEMNGAMVASAMPHRTNTDCTARTTRDGIRGPYDPRSLGGSCLPPVVLALIAVAAVMHAAWNVILKRSGDPLITSGRAMIAGTLAFAPLAVIAWLASGRPAIPVEALALGVVSGLIEVVYLV